jgi:dolichol-phosphate mannosyltransferase
MMTIFQSEILSLHQGISIPGISVIVPVYNECSTVTIALDSILEEGTRKEVIIVDDGSDDGTGQVLNEWIRSIPPLVGAAVRVILLKHSENRGKGRAIRTALEVARGEYVIVQDADLEVRPCCYAALLAPLVDGTAEFVMGCRWRHPMSRLSIHALGVVTLGLIVRSLYGYHVRDAACCFKVVSLENLRRMDLEADQFEFCPEVIAKASRLGLTLKQVDIDYFPRGVREGKKLRLVKDGTKALQTLLRYRQWQPATNRLQPGTWHERSESGSPNDRSCRTSVTLKVRQNDFQHRRAPMNENNTGQRQLSFEELTAWAEFCAWSGLIMTPVLWWLQGASVSPDQFAVRTSVVVLSAIAATGLRLRTIFAPSLPRDVEFQAGTSSDIKA